MSDTSTWDPELAFFYQQYVEAVPSASIKTIRGTIAHHEAHCALGHLEAADHEYSQAILEVAHAEVARRGESTETL